VHPACRGLMAVALACQVADAVYFDTIKVSVPDAAAVCHKAVAAGMNLRQLDAKTVTVSLDETTEPADVETLLKVFGVASPDVTALASKVAAIPPGFISVVCASRSSFIAA